MTGPAAPVAQVGTQAQFGLVVRAFEDLAGRPDGAGRPQVPDAATLSRLLAGLRRQRPDDLDWWLELARAWYDVPGGAGHVWCALQRAATVAVGATWEQRRSLAELAAAVQLRDAAGPGVTEAEPIRGETYRAKRQRIDLMFGRGDSSEVRARVERLHAERAIERLVLCAPVSVARQALMGHCHDAGEHHLVVELFMASVADRLLSTWLTDPVDPLFWCGRALERLGDRASAQACFRLALRADADAEEPPDDEADGIGRIVRRAQVRTRDAAASLDTGIGVHPLMHGGSRLVAWLTGRGLPGYFPLFADSFVRSGLFRDAPGVLARQIRTAASVHGWFPPTVDDVTHSAAGERPVIRSSLPPPPRPLPLALRTAGRSTLTAPPPGRLAPASAAATVRIGVTEFGAGASIELHPERPVAALGSAATLVTEVVIDQLVRDGWTALWLDVGSTVAAAGWTAVSGTAIPRWVGCDLLRRVIGTVDGRRALRHVLAATLPRCADPAAPTLLRTLVDSLCDRDLITLFGRGRHEIEQLAATLVDAAANLSFRRVRDLRRAASLWEYATTALRALRHAATLDIIEAAEPNSGRAQVYLPGSEPVGLAVSALVCLRSLSEPAITEAPSAAAPAGNDDWSIDIPLQVSLRPDKADADEILSMVRTVRAPSDAQPPVTDPWSTVRAPGGRLVVLVTGSLGAGWQPFLSVLEHPDRGSVPPWTVLTAIADPTPADLDTCGRYDSVLLGELGPHLLDRLEAGSGWRVGQLAGAGLGPVGLVQARRGSRPVRVALWPTASRRGNADGR